MLDGGLVVGYLTAALLKGARRVADAGVEALLDRLVAAVEARIGSRPVDALARDPANAPTVEANVQAALRSDPAFAQTVLELVRELDARGARELVNQVQAHSNVQVLGDGTAIGRDQWNITGADPSDLSGAPGWVKACVVVGGLLAFSALAVFGWAVLTHDPEPSSPELMDVPAGIPLAGAIFLVGFFVFGAGALGRSFSRRR